MLQWPPDIGGGGVDPQVNNFEEVSNDGHHMSLAGDGAEVRGSHVSCPEGAGGWAGDQRASKVQCIIW